MHADFKVFYGGGQKCPIHLCICLLKLYQKSSQCNASLDSKFVAMRSQTSTDL